MKNVVKISGTVKEEPVFNHNVQEERFYRLIVCITRLSGEVDEIPMFVSEKYLDLEKTYTGCGVRISGQFRSYNLSEESKTKLILYVHPYSIEFVDEIEFVNEIQFEGILCKEPVYRETPKGRKITDLLIANNQTYGRSYYFPCICWGKRATYANTLHVGDEIMIKGRLQSRIYNKAGEKKIAYEISVSDIFESGAKE